MELLFRAKSSRLASASGQLREQSGHKTVRTEVDRAYLTSQIQNHQKTANLLLRELGTGQNQDLTKFAADTLPVVLDHLEMAKRHYAQTEFGAAGALGFTASHRLRYHQIEHTDQGYERNDAERHPPA